MGQDRKRQGKIPQVARQARKREGLRTAGKGKARKKVTARWLALELEVKIPALGLQRK